MPRIDALIEKLKQQYHAGAPLPQMLATLQLLHTEIAGGLKETEVLGTSGVSVLIPNVPAVHYPKQINPFEDNTVVYFELPEAEASDEEIDELLLQQSGIVSQEGLYKGRHNDNSQGEQYKHAKAKKENIQSEFAFGDEKTDNLSDIPTYAQYVRGPATERSSKEILIRNLTKIISEADKKTFIAELFRGDVAMYERSIKTIDNFHAYAEAEFWVRRELKTKIGWPPNSIMAAKFDQLVKKRFG